jgi:hypothetical protein
MRVWRYESGFITWYNTLMYKRALEIVSNMYTFIF